MPKHVDLGVCISLVCFDACKICVENVVKSLGVESHVLIKCAELLSETFPNV
jgi:hypothetical protein